MAVTVVSSPPVSPFVISTSYPAVIEMTSNIYGGAGITQFRYKAEVTAIVDLGVKYTVPSVATLSTGYFDVHDLFKLLLFLRPEEYDGGSFDGDPITQITAPLQQASFVQFSFQVVIKEQYFNSGVFTTNTGPTLTFVAARGYTDKTDSEWFYCNYNQLPELNETRKWMPLSGHAFQVLAVKSKDPSWNSTGVDPYIGIQLYVTNGGVEAIIETWFFTRDTVGYQGAVYVPLRHTGSTDQDDFEQIRVRVLTNPNNTSIGPGSTLVEEITLDKTVDLCEDEQVVMFQDRFLQWSFMSFSQYGFTTINTQPQSAEAIDGRFRYNVKSSDVLTLNTDWLDDLQNELMRDLIASEQTYLVSAVDGSLEKVTVVPNSLRLQESTVDGIHQYQMQFRKSLDNFKV